MKNTERIQKLKKALIELRKFKKSADAKLRKANVKFKKGKDLLQKACKKSGNKDKTLHDKLETLNDSIFDINKQIKSADYLYRKYVEKINKELRKLSI